MWLTIYNCLQPIDSWSILPKHAFLGIMEIFSLDTSQISTNYSKRRLQHDSIPFFPLTPRFTTFLLGHAQKSIFGVFLILFSPFLFLLFLSFCGRDWPSTGLRLLPAHKVWESIIETGNFYRGVAKCSRSKFCSAFFTQFSEHFSELITQIWVSLERSFPPAKLECRWCQLWSKVMTSKVEQRPALVTVKGGQSHLKLSKI